MLTKDWVESHGISSDPNPPLVVDYNEPCGRTERDIAIRSVIIVAVGAEVEPRPIIDWFHEQEIWDYVTPNERAFLINPSMPEDVRNRFSWHMEVEWTLLWAISKVEFLGLPIKHCDSSRLVDEIIPALGSDIENFLTPAQLRPPGLLLAEEIVHIICGPMLNQLVVMEHCQKI